MDFLKRKPKDLDGAEADGRDAVDETGSIIDNDKAQKRQRRGNQAWARDRGFD